MFDADEALVAATWLRQMIALLVTVGLVLLVCLVEAFNLNGAHSRRERGRERQSNESGGISPEPSDGGGIRLMMGRKGIIKRVGRRV